MTRRSPVKIKNYSRPVSDGLEARLGTYYPVLDHGFVAPLDYMGNDDSIVQAARVSYGMGTKQKNDGTGLINTLMRNRHTSPFEMPSIMLHMKLPIFVARQWIRHRTASLNEYSARYSVLDKEFYIPEIEQLQPQSKTNNQGRDGMLSEALQERALDVIRTNSEETYADYEMLLREGFFEDSDGITIQGCGLTRELSRMVLPTNIYTQWYWKIDAHNLLHLLKLRDDPHAQWEIQQYAKVISDIVSDWLPKTFDAYRTYVKESVTFSEKELKLLVGLTDNPVSQAALKAYQNIEPGAMGVSKTEWNDFMKKLKRFE